MDENNTCPILSPERLCRIQSEHGQSFLSNTCATYPRIVHSVGGFKLPSLALSCPEAARNVLLKPITWKRIERVEPSVDKPLLDEFLIPSAYWPIRSTVLALVQNRKYPLWQRLFLLGVLCRKLDALAAEERDFEVPGLLAAFNKTVATGKWRPAIEPTSLDLQVHVDAVLRLAGLMLDKSNVTARFVECIQEFATGIGNGPSATLETLAAGFKVAHDRYFVPFFDGHPHILENYVLNTILRRQFPFGRDGMKPGTIPVMTRELTTLVAQFSLMKGLLIGVAGFHRDTLATASVVDTIQATSKHFDHHPDFSKLANELLTVLKLNGLKGAAVLLAPPLPASLDPNFCPPSQQPAFPIRLNLQSATCLSPT